MDAAPARTRYERHCPEATLLYELVEQHYPEFVETLEREGRSLPSHVGQEFDAYLKWADPYADETVGPTRRSVGCLNDLYPEAGR